MANKPYLTDPLWQRIAAHPFDAPGDARPFSKKLAHEQGWTAAFATRTIAEYRRFVYLCCAFPEGASPPPIVDEVWHLHLTYTVDYWTRFCPQTLQRDLHHHPSRGGPDEHRRHHDWYADTLERYRRTFGQSPPANIWPPPAPATHAASSAPQPAGLAGLSWKNLPALISPFGLILFLYGQPTPFRLSGPHFLVFYPALAAACFALLQLHYQQVARGMKAALSERIPQDPYELAWLSGGQKRMLLLLVTDWIDAGILEHLHGQFYRISHRHRVQSKHPHAAMLANWQAIDLTYLSNLTADIAAPYEETYQELKQAFDWRKKAVLLPVLLLAATGILRMAQGIATAHPVGYLCLMIVLAAAVALAIIRACSFHQSCTRLFRNQPDHYIAAVRPDLQRTIILTGFVSLAYLPAYRHLTAYFMPQCGNGDGSSGSGCSSGGDGGGGGCGGGCGGCGGD